jgi:hypothetical protein
MVSENVPLPPDVFWPLFLTPVSIADNRWSCTPGVLFSHLLRIAVDNVHAPTTHRSRQCARIERAVSWDGFTSFLQLSDNVSSHRLPFLVRSSSNALYLPVRFAGVRVLFETIQYLLTKRLCT